MNVRKFSKHENKSSYSHRDEGNLLAKARILLSLRVVYVNLVYDVFECKNALTFNGEGFAAFANIRTEPYAENPCV